MAEHLGVDRKSVGRWETDGGNPSASHLAGAAELGMDVAWVLTGRHYFSDTRADYSNSIDLGELSEESRRAIQTLVKQLKVSESG